MKKTISVILTVLTVLLLLSGCGTKAKENGKLNIVVTTFPQYDWVRNILGEKKDSANLTMLIDNGVDLHSFQPSASDIVKISNCDLFIYVGGVSDEWVGDALKTANNKNMKVINLLDVLGKNAKEEEIIEGMEAEGEHEHEHEGEEETEYDEHVWLSLKNAKLYCEKIANSLIQLDKENKSVYSSNLDNYLKNLDALDKEYEEAINAASVKTILFGDRFPFRYLTDDYGLNYYAAFAGCSAETEASFETVSFLSQKVDELGLKSVLTIEGANHKLAETVVKNTKAKNAKILTVNSIQSVTADDVKSGADYLKIMKENLEVLKEALN